MRHIALLLLGLAAAPLALPADDASSPVTTPATTSRPATATRPPSGPPPAPATRTTARLASSGRPDPAHDRLELDATSITGDRELPKVMSIVPWKAAEPPAGPDRPMGSLIDELIAPIDRDEFRREIAYYRDLTGPSGPAASATRVLTPGADKP
jgi:hypothetical protein